MGGFFENKNVRDIKISEYLISECGSTNLWFNEPKPFPHGNSNKYGPPFNLTNSRFNKLYCDSARVR